MSSNLAYALPARRPLREVAAEQHPRRIAAVEPRVARRSKPRVAYALVAIAVIFVIFLAQLLLSISLSSGAYRINGLQVTQRNLGRESSALNERLDTLGSTQNLVANARALGMVASGSQAFLRLSDGKVLGVSTAAKGSHGQRIVPAASGSVPNYLLTNVALVTASSTGHGHANAAESTSTGSESNSDQSSGNTSIEPASSGDLPSPQTH